MALPKMAYEQLGSPPARGRGLKSLAYSSFSRTIFVAPCAGAWIEMG